ncbi:FAD-dependent monooxygenase [Amnibacterium setariae]|uniref:FAD-dependent monooxygenase n=1 Tax=Amnibacterium setariae TaxID=2306585 RepID=A0A3A1U3U5_9MICO|nr:NAD(P)/FAD-dependent oxidoreductase [Amnibacterium setariae]RIX31201.1 FAD-dependent monooxygenase [Amnibacterium setariae]
MRALIVGGGAAGLATALALHDRGVASTVLERRSPAAAAAGSRLTVAPNGLSAAAALGVLADLEAVGAPTDENLLVGATGRVLGTVSIGVPLASGLRGLTLRRADLVAVLAEHAAGRGVEVRADARVVEVDVADGAVRTERGERLRGDVLVGADGVRSLVRRAVDPGAPAPRYVGLTNFGGVTADPGIAAGLRPRAWTMVFGRRAFFGAHPLPSGEVVWFVNVPEPPIPAEVRATTTDDRWRERLVALVQDDAGPAAALIAAGRLELAGDSTYDLPRVRRWRRGTAVLVGDAAHAPSPSSGQGASMALEDGVVLGRELTAAGRGVEEGLAAFERARRRRVQRIVAAGARASSSKIPGPVGARVQESVMRLLFRTVVTERGGAWMTGARW